MANFRKKPVVIKAITFDELVKHGVKFIEDHPETGNFGPDEKTPWSFNYDGHPITHENNECYLIPTLEGTMQMTTKDMLITGIDGEIYPCKIDIFNKTYDKVD